MSLDTSLPTNVPPETVPVLVNTPALLAAMIGHLQRHPALALDTESNSFHAYYPKVCLIQITTFADSNHSIDDLAVDSPKSENREAAECVVDYLVDPLSLGDLSPLGALLGSGIEVVMHAADNDIILLQRDFGFRIARVFDTQLAARILGWQHAGLGAILESSFGVVSDKSMQRTEWSRRPLSAAQIAYAQMDTHYLFALRDLLTQELYAADRMEEAQAGFAMLRRLDDSAREPAERDFWSMRAAHKAPLAQLGMLQALWEWREGEAQRQNRPPFKVMSDDTLLAIAQRRPATTNELKEIRAISSEQLRRYGAALRPVIADGAQRPQPTLPKASPRADMLLSGSEKTQYERLRAWRTKRAEVRGVAPEIIFNNDTLLAIVQQRPTSIEQMAAMATVGTWKAQTYGAEVLAILGNT